MTVGTQRFQFNRLIKKLDELVERGEIKEKIIAQTGYSTYKPSNFESNTIIDSNKVLEYIALSDVIITHAGTSSIINCLKQKKKVIVIPRLKKFGEHVDDHQMDIIKLFESQEMIEAIYDIDQLGDKLKKAKNKTYKEFLSDNKLLLCDIENYLETLL